MRMAKDFDDPREQFRGEPAGKRHIGPGPKLGPKRAVNLSIDAEILAAAKAQGINLSQTL